MTNWLKTLWKDMGTLSSGHFFHKYVLPAIAIFFTWGLIGHLYLIFLDKDSLVNNTGQVSDIAIKFEQGTRRHDKHYPLKIQLSAFPEEFRLPDAYKVDFHDLQSKIRVNDLITIYTRNKWQTVLGWGEQADIYQIDKNGRTLFEIAKVKEEKKTQASIFTLLTVIFWTWYIIYRRRTNKILPEAVKQTL